MCDPLIRRYETAHGIPNKLLTAISLVESGRKMGRSVVAWPWTINANGKPYVFATKQEAIRMVRKLRLIGVTSIDVGCMQVNLKQHPKAFSSLDEAFDPATNIAYAAKFLKAKKEGQGSWVNAVGHYHSSTAKFHVPYRAKVLKTWEKVQTGRLAFQALPEISQMLIGMDSVDLDKHKGQFVENVAAPSGRRLPMLVRFAPYKGFNGGIPGIAHLASQGRGGAQIIRGRPVRASGKIIINNIGMVPNQGGLLFQGANISPKVIYVSQKVSQIALPVQSQDPVASKLPIKSR
jgi:hypothetical protein